MFNHRRFTFLFTCLFAITFLVIPSAYNRQKVNAQATDQVLIGVTNSSIKIEHNLLQALQEAVKGKLGNEILTKNFLVGSLRSYKDEWYLVTLVTTLKEKKSDTQKDTDIVDTYLLLVHNDNGKWEVVFNDNQVEFTQKINEVLAEFVPDSSKNFLNNIGGMSPLTVLAFKFPWPSGISYYYSQGWHEIAGGIGHLDLGTTNSDRRILAVGDGVIQTVTTCPITTKITILHTGSNTIEYYHLASSSVPPSIQSMATVYQGTVLGSAKTGTFSEYPCGFANQNDASSHVHLGIPTTNTPTFDGWSISYPSSAFTNGGTTVNPPIYTPSLPSTNVVNPGRKEIQEISGYYDTDSKTDLAFFDPNTGHWYIRYTGGAADADIVFGWSTAIPIGGGDYDGDGRTGLAIFEPTTGHWYVRPSNGGADWDIPFGWSTTLPVGGMKYDTDNKTDMAIFDTATGRWYIRPSAGGTDWNILFGWSTTIPIGGGYYDTDTKTDLAIFDKNTGHWYIRYTGGGADADITFGWSTTIPVGGGKYDSDNKTDLAIFDTASGRWYIRPSAGGADWNILFGWSTTIPKPGMNYDTNSRTDLAIWDKNTAHWYIRPSGGGSDWDILFGWQGVTPI